MWLGTGLLTLAASIGWRWYAQKNPWTGETDRCNGLAYQYKRIPGKYNDQLFIGIPITEGINCVFRNENWLDRAFKAARLTKEHQTGHRSFDERVYFISDSTAVQDLVSHNPLIANGLLKIMDSAPHGANFVALRCRNARLWVEYKLKGELRADKAILAMASLCVKPLHAIANEFNRASPANQKLWHDRHYWIAAFFSILASGLLVNGFAQFFLLTGTTAEHLPDTSIHAHTRMITLTATAVLLTLAAVLLGRTSRAHMTLIEVLLAGGIGLYATTYTTLRDINKELDTETELLQSEVISKRIEKGRRTSATRYYLNIRATEKTPEMWLRVIETLYADAGYKTPVQMDFHKGKLGYPWVTGLRRRPTINESADPKPSPAASR